MSLKESLDYNIIKEFAEQNDIDFVAVYGSYFKGKNTSKSDLDLIIDARKLITTEKLVEYSKKLSKLLNRKVDLITPKLMINSLICGYVWRLKEYEVIYGKPVVLEDE